MVKLFARAMEGRKEMNNSEFTPGPGNNNTSRNLITRMKLIIRK